MADARTFAEAAEALTAEIRDTLERAPHSALVDALVAAATAEQRAAVIEARAAQLLASLSPTQRERVRRRDRPWSAVQVALPALADLADALAAPHAPVEAPLDENSLEYQLSVRRFPRVDDDIIEEVHAMRPESLGQRVAMERTLQDKRDRLGDSMTAMSHETTGFCFCGTVHAPDPEDPTDDR